MGRQEQSGGAVIAVILIGGLLVLFVGGGLVLCGGLMLWKRAAVEMPIEMNAQVIEMKAQVSPSASEAMISEGIFIKIETDADGVILIGGNRYTDDEFRVLLEEQDAQSDISIMLDADIDDERRAEIEAIHREVVE